MKLIVEKWRFFCYTLNMKEKGGQIFLEFFSDIRFIEYCILVLGFLRDVLLIPEEDFFKIEISLREILNNAILHGNKSDIRKRVFVKFKWSKSYICIGVRDENTEEVDFDSITENIEKKDVLSVSGRGIMIVKNYMDNVKFISSSKGNEIVIEKKI